MISTFFKNFYICVNLKQFFSIKGMFITVKIACRNMYMGVCLTYYDLVWFAYTQLHFMRSG